MCKTVNGTAEVSPGWVEVYIGEILVWRSYVTDHTVVIVRPLEIVTHLLKVSGYILIKNVKFLNGTYRDVYLEFINNTVDFSVGNINYPVEIRTSKYV